MVREISLSKVCVRKLRQDIWRDKTFVRSCIFKLLLIFDDFNLIRFQTFEVTLPAENPA